jgi:cytochrome c-type biogenesis protein
MISLWIAFAGGVVSFLSPCVLPIIPGFLAYLAGSSTGESGAKRSQIFLNSLFFVIGFSIVFALLGVLLNTVLKFVAGDVRTWLSWIGGTLIIFFGLYLTGLIHLPFLDREYHFGNSRLFRSRYLTSFVFGASFAAGWTPCVGPALASILGLALSGAAGTAFYLLMAYAVGLGVPFLVVGLFAAQAAGFFNRYANALHYVNIAFGVILVVLGILVFTQEINALANFGLLNSLLLRQ